MMQVLTATFAPYIDEINESLDKGNALHSNHSTELRFMCVIHDKEAVEDSDPFMSLNAVGAIRTLKGYIKNLPSHLDKDDFRLDIIGIYYKYNLYPVERYTLMEGAQLQEKPDA